MIVLSLLFAVAMLFAVATIVIGAMQHWRTALALRGELADCPALREVRYTVTELKVLGSPARVYALPVRRVVSPSLPTLRAA